MWVMESIMDHVQRTVNADPIKLREHHFYVSSDKTHFVCVCARGSA
jgi:hypothetical protein